MHKFKCRICNHILEYRNDQECYYDGCSGKKTFNTLYKDLRCSWYEKKHPMDNILPCPMCRNTINLKECYYRTKTEEGEDWKAWIASAVIVLVIILLFVLYQIVV